MKRRIKQTLLKSLFYSPSGYCKKQLDKYKDEIFPGQDDFICFLQEVNYEVVVDLSMRILHRLVFGMRCTPTISLLKNIHKLENYLQYETKDGYIGRDHLVHLVNVYLLGVYIYFYHKGFREAISQQLESCRHGYPAYRQEGNSLTLDFVKCWKLFALSHDVGYSVEAYSYCDSAKKDKFKDEFFQVNRIHEFLTREYASKALSRILGLALVLESSGEVTLDKRLKSSMESGKFCLQSPVKDFACESCQDRTVCNDASRFSLLPRSVDASTIMFARTVLEPGSFAAVLETEDHTVLAVILPCGTSLSQDKVYINRQVARGYTEAALLKSAYSSRTSLGRTLSWRYYSTKVEVALKPMFELLLRDIKTSDVDDRLNWSDFQGLVEAVRDLIPVTKSVFSSDGSYFENLCFCIYLNIMNTLGIYRSARQELYSENSKVKSLTLRDLRLAFTRNLNEKISQAIDSATSSLPDKPAGVDWISTHVRLLFSRVKESIQDPQFERTTFESITEQLGAQSQYVLQVFNFFRGFERLLSVSEIEGNVYSNFNPNKMNLFSFLADEPRPYRDDLFFKTFEGADFQRYLSFQKSSNHGIHSYSVMSLIRQMVSRSTTFAYGVDISEVFASTGSSTVELDQVDSRLRWLLKFVFNIHTDRDLRAHRYDLDVLSDLPLFGVLLHNEILSEFVDNNNKQVFGSCISIDKAPFVYLCILSDELQRWERKRNANQAFVSLPYSTYADRYNLQIRGNQIEIQEFANGADISALVMDFNSSFGRKLCASREILSLNISENG